MTTVYKFKVGYTRAGLNIAPSVSPLVTVINVDTNSLLVTSGSSSTLSNMAGVYYYNYTGSDNLNLVANFYTSDATIDQRTLWDMDNTSYIVNLLGTLPTASQIDTQLSSTHSTGSWGGGGTTTGSGATTYPVTVTVNGVPQDGVEVWVTTDLAGNNTIASGVTNALGVVTFYLDAGTYYFWKQFAGANFTNPETGVVT